MASVRFICGTQDIHKTLENTLADFLGMEDAILYSSCFDANGGLFETLLGEDDAIISDALNHASVIDDVRLCKARRYRYDNNDMQQLEAQLQKAKAEGARTLMVATDGVFSMDGVIANLKGICDVAERYGALVMVDDSHAVGFVGKQGRGSHEYCDVMGRVNILTGTLGKALGGASGGYVAARKRLRQRSRPYLFSNSLAPAIVTASIAVLDLLAQGDALRERLWENAALFRKLMTATGFTLAGADHAIIPVMLGDARLAQDFALAMQREGFDVGLEISGTPAAMHALLHAMNHGGRVALLGIPPEPMMVDWNEVIFKGLTIKGIYGREMFETWYKMASLIQSGLDLTPIITHHFPIDDFQQGFDVMRSGQSGKVILHWD